MDWWPRSRRWIAGREKSAPRPCRPAAPRSHLRKHIHHLRAELRQVIRLSARDEPLVHLATARSTHSPPAFRISVLRLGHDVRERPANGIGLDQQPRAMANRRHGLVGVHERADERDGTRVCAQLVRVRDPSRQHETVVLACTDICDDAIDGEAARRLGRPGSPVSHRPRARRDEAPRPHAIEHPKARPALCCSTPLVARNAILRPLIPGGHRVVEFWLGSRTMRLIARIPSCIVGTGRSHDSCRLRLVRGSSARHFPHVSIVPIYGHDALRARLASAIHSRDAAVEPSPPREARGRQAAARAVARAGARLREPAAATERPAAAARRAGLRRALGHPDIHWFFPAHVSRPTPRRQTSWTTSPTRSPSE